MLPLSKITHRCKAASYLAIFMLGALSVGVRNLSQSVKLSTDNNNILFHDKSLSIPPSESTPTKVRTNNNAHDSSNDITNNPDHLQSLEPTHHACDNYDGVYHIAMGDIKGGVGTALIQLVIGQIQYAERYRLKPFVHMLPNISEVVFDPVVHGQTSNDDQSYHAIGARNATYQARSGGDWRDKVPGPPNATQPIQPFSYRLPGTGIWNHYFEPISDFVPGDESCSRKLYVTMDLYLIIPGLHGYSDDFATRCWRYDYLPEYLAKSHLPYDSWIEPQRIRAHRIVQQYIRFRPYLHKAAELANPHCCNARQRVSTSNDKCMWCLGLHIRHSDKAAGRRIVSTAEFLPFAEAFVANGGHQIYVATDSVKVLEEIQLSWPANVRNKVRSLGGNANKESPATTSVVRSSNEKAVFNMASHHQTNKEALTEILAISRCQFLVHGFSAISESSIWINLDLHNQSVNLEDEEHMDSEVFGTLVRSAIEGKPKEIWPHAVRTEAWWMTPSSIASEDKNERDTGCTNFDGILHIASTGPEATFGTAFFIDVLNQLLYAEKYNLFPWIHLEQESSQLVYDVKEHSISTTPAFRVQLTLPITYGDNGTEMVGGPSLKTGASTDYKVQGSGVWQRYFQPIPAMESCHEKPLLRLDQKAVEQLRSLHPWSVKAWRYDNVPDIAWKGPNNQLSDNDIFARMRQQAQTLVQKYYNFQPYIVQRASQVNPTTAQKPCLGVHIRVGDKRLGRYRTKKIKADAYLPYLDAFVNAGGQVIYVASDSHKSLQFLQRQAPPEVVGRLFSQGKYVVRTWTDWPTHLLDDDQHRINAETLVDILALSYCPILLHSYSTVAEAALYVSGTTTSINLEDPHHPTPQEFQDVVRRVLGTKTKNG